MDNIMGAIMFPLALALGALTFFLLGPIFGVCTFIGVITLIVFGGVREWYMYRNVIKVLDRIERVVGIFQLARLKFASREDVYEATKGWRPDQRVIIKRWPMRNQVGATVRKQLDARFVGLTDRETAVFELDYAVHGTKVIELDGRDFVVHSPRNQDAEREEVKIKEARLKEEAMNSFATTRLEEFRSIMDGTDDELERITTGTTRTKTKA